MSETVERAGARRIRWHELEADHPMPLLERRRIHGERMTIARVELRKGFRIDAHSHHEEQIAIVLAGKIRSTCHWCVVPGGSCRLGSDSPGLTARESIEKSL